ncbi:MAG: aminopeptidase [Eubacteriales bacterium]
MDERIKQLAEGLVDYSCKVKKGEKVYVHYVGEATCDLAREIVKKVYERGGIPFAHYSDQKMLREILMECNKEQLSLMTQVDSIEMKEMDCYIGIRGTNNISELSDVPREKMELYDELYSDPIHHKIRVPHTRWVVLRYPNASMAQLAGSSSEAFEKFYFDVCNLDYSKMGKAMESLVTYLNRTDQVRMVGPDTDITFSIKDIAAVPCCGLRNIPDGEVYTAPIRNSVNGTITYNTPSVYQGFVYEKIQFTFENGKIIKATANDTERINQVLDMDEGARYIGEFAIGVNPYILHPMKDTLFDEKINGSIHFTPGNCYDTASNGNHSKLHWDLVWIQRADYGGGEIYFDNVLVRKDGIFVVSELECLNPEHLVGTE